jgi:hypothetical protein
MPAVAARQAQMQWPRRSDAPRMPSGFRTEAGRVGAISDQGWAREFDDRSNRPPRRQKAAHAARSGEIRYRPSEERSHGAGMAGCDRCPDNCIIASARVRSLNLISSYCTHWPVANSLTQLPGRNDSPTGKLRSGSVARDGLTSSLSHPPGTAHRRTRVWRWAGSRSAASGAALSSHV